MGKFRITYLKNSGKTELVDIFEGGDTEKVGDVLLHIGSHSRDGSKENPYKELEGATILRIEKVTTQQVP